MFEESKRGGISGTGSKKFVINIDCPNHIKQIFYDQCLKHKIKVQPEGVINYIDENSLYAWALSLPLPVSDFSLIDH